LSSEVPLDMNAYDDMKKIKLSVARLWYVPGVSPRCKHKFHGELIFYEEEISVTQWHSWWHRYAAGYNAAERFDTVRLQDERDRRTAARQHRPRLCIAAPQKLPTALLLVSRK